ncbi:protein-export chaperone SecB [Wielerella bovis]|uniref:protein-export chaperone SecB n=1 Tax=Wielerella bovis TaxID=2917790 RepID=UPI0020195C1C|nr:protein-export chaperone SecB [Wielerella bovis]MCG7658005.1 protein-export chaperone SecB [Wielerella bovis]MCG7660227.1 protein-export chaperone SecB [Wielerella bovis]
MSNEQAAQPTFSVEKLYVKDLSLEVPHAPAIFLEQETPEVDMRITTENAKVEEDFYECSVTVTVTAKLNDGRVVFLNEVTQAGIFHVSNVSEEDVKLLLGVACPNILFPYAREAVSTTVTRAGFPPVLLAPINFDAMYHQAQEQQAQ